MRPSCYFNAVEVGGGVSLLYNGLSMCLDIVPSELANRLVSQDGGDFSFLAPAEREHLVKRGHLTGLSLEAEQEKMGELARSIIENSCQEGQRSGGKMVTFILTYRCNLSCVYCFQNKVRGSLRHPLMSESFVDNFLRGHLDKLFPGTPGDGLRFILFGGEPLLPGNRAAIERILRYAKEHGVYVSATTNAMTLPNMVDLIGPETGKINGIQVTLDGERAFHDNTRVSSSGAPTFEKTIRALGHVVEANAKAIIRIHLHPDRIESARELVEYLEQANILANGNVEIYFAPVHSFHTKEISPADLENFSGLFQYVALKQQKAPIQNFDILEHIMNIKTINGLTRPRYCAVSSGSHIAVDPHGDIYECLEEAGRKERRIGTISGEEIEFFKLRETYKNSYLASTPECLKCSIALFCGGGCISKTRTHGGSAVKQFCAQNKLFVGQTLKACFLIKKAGAVTGARPIND